jgi:hypothetical protein
MYAHDCANISSKISAASSEGKILARIETVGIDHEVAIVLVNGWSLASVPVVEELWQSLALNVVDRVHIKPSAVTWEDNGVCLRD